MKKNIVRLSLLAAGFTASLSAAELSIEIRNLTQGNYFTPLMVTAHSSDADIYELGTAASEQLQAVAEGGSLTTLQTLLESVSATINANPAEGLLGPSESVTIESFNTDNTENNYLSIVSMVLPTNDAFVGLDSWAIPETPGTYTLYLNAYDSGTEANDELLNTVDGGASGIAGIPAAPGGAGGENGTGVTTEEANTTVHVHRGIIGDTDPAGGTSDLDATVHRWMNPVAKVIVTVQ